MRGDRISHRDSCTGAFPRCHNKDGSKALDFEHVQKHARYENHIVIYANSKSIREKHYTVSQERNPVSVRAADCK